MTIYMDPIPLVYETKFEDGRNLCIGGGIAVDRSEVDGTDIQIYLKNLGEPYKRVYDLKFDSSVVERDERLNFACSLKPVSDVVMDRRSADEDRIPEWLNHLIKISRKRNLEKIVVDANISTLKQIKSRLGLNTEYFFMTRLGERFELDSQERALTEIIEYGVRCVELGNDLPSSVLSFPGDQVLMILGQIKRINLS